MTPARAGVSIKSDAAYGSVDTGRIHGRGPHVDEGIGPTIGQRLAQLRGTRMTQTALAASAGVSVDLVRKLEQGQRHTVTIGNLHRLARALDVDASDLLSKTGSLPHPGPDSGAVAIRRALTSVADLIDDDADLTPLSLTEARRTLTYGWGTYWAGRYDQLGHLLPGAIVQSRAIVRTVPAAERAEACELAASVHRLAACTVVHLGYGDVAHLALREALRLAEQGADELLPAALRSSVAWLLLTQGRFTESHDLATVTAASLAPTETSSPAAWSLYGSLLLSGATAAGRSGDRSVAGGLLDEASTAADRTGDRFDYESAFGPDQVLMQTVDVEIVTENYDAALSVSERMPRDTSLPLAARARHLSDLALARTRLNHDGAALDTLLTMETLAPAWTYYQAQPRQIVRELRDRSTDPRLTDLARRIGLIAA